MPSEKEIIAKIQRELMAIADKDPNWRFYHGWESLSASEVVKRLEKDPKLRKMVLTNYRAIIEQKAREKGAKL